jgi:hypothetical protein
MLCCCHNSLLTGRALALPRYPTITTPVVSAVRSELDCGLLDLHADMADLDFEYEGVEYTAKKVHYEPFVKYQGRHSWTGAIVEPTTVGSVTVTWNDDCDAAVFALQVSSSFV